MGLCGTWHKGISHRPCLDFVWFHFMVEDTAWVTLSLRTRNAPTCQAAGSSRLWGRDKPPCPMASRWEVPELAWPAGSHRQRLWGGRAIKGKGLPARAEGVSPDSFPGAQGVWVVKRLWSHFVLSASEAGHLKPYSQPLCDRILSGHVWEVQIMTLYQVHNISDTSKIRIV
jgi:hypothetical protein